MMWTRAIVMISVFHTLLSFPPVQSAPLDPLPNCTYYVMMMNNTEVQCFHKMGGIVPVCNNSISSEECSIKTKKNLTCLKWMNMWTDKLSCIIGDLKERNLKEGRCASDQTTISCAAELGTDSGLKGDAARMRSPGIFTLLITLFILLVSLYIIN